MSSRNISFNGEGLPSSRCAQRTPLKNVQNEMLHLSTPSSRFKSKSQFSADVTKQTKGDVLCCNPEPHLSSPSTKVIQFNTSATDINATETACGDVTFKSFVCPGGEVEVTDSRLCAEESLFLPKDQTTENTEDTVLSDSTAVQSCSDHIEHPYYHPERKEASLVDAVPLCEVSNSTLASGDLDDRNVTQDFRAFRNDCCEKTDVTWKSFVCDGGEVQISDVTRVEDETIPLPKAPLAEPSQDISVNLTDLSGCGQLCQVEHAEHPYFNSRNGVCVITTFSEATDGSDKPADGLSDVTFKSFNCTGGVIEISDGTKLADDTIPLPADQTAACGVSCNNGMNPSMLATDQDVPKGPGHHKDHPYCDIETNPLDEPLPFIVNEQISGQEVMTSSSIISARADAEIYQTTSPLPDIQDVISCPPDDNGVQTQDHIQDDDEQANSSRTVEGTDAPANCASSLINTPVKAFDDESVDCQLQETPKKECMQPEDSALPSLPHRSVEESVICSNLALLTETPKPVRVQVEHVSEVQIKPQESSDGKDSAFGSSENGPVPCSSAEKAQEEKMAGALKVLSDRPSVASAFQFGILSPVVRRASLAALRAFKAPPLDPFLAEDSALEVEKSLLAPLNTDPTGLWPELLESPMPRPLFNSTALGSKPQADPATEPVRQEDAKPCAVPQPEVEKPLLDTPLIPDGPLQQQLRQMAEFLFLASGKMVPAAVAVPSAEAPPTESHSVCVGTSPVKWLDHSVNTSGQFERKRDFTVSDSCTLTDPLLWNVPAGTLECLPREELVHRLSSSMIMVEALVQQLAASRARGCPSGGPPPSELREKLVQTDHTELSQTTMYRDLYLEALSRIAELELDSSSLQTLIQSMQDMKVTMNSLGCDTDAALSNLRRIQDVVREDHQSLVSHYGQMKSLFEKTKTMQTAVMQKVKDALQQKQDMRLQMEDAFTAKEAAFSVMEQLRTHCATEISALQRTVGSQQDLSAALRQTYPEQAALNQDVTEALTSASNVLSTTMEEQSSLMKELCTVRTLLQKTAPVLLKLNEKAAAALRERDEHLSAREQAVEEREQIEEELNQANMNLQTATEQIGDLNLQVTILTSEMGVLRQKLTEREEEKGLLDRKVTELSATVSSTLASYTFLEQALAAETTKLQQSWKDIQVAKNRANELESSLAQSEQRECELSQALAQSEEQLSQLQLLSQSQNTQIQQLQELCAQLSGVREMNEFLQVENDFAREQMAESERVLRANLQGLRERNIECEDLKGELAQLKVESRSLQQELETTKSRAGATELELGQKLAQAVTEITLVHHTLRGMTDDLHASLSEQTTEPQRDKESQRAVDRRHPSSSFVDSIMVALTSEKSDVVAAETPVGSDESEPQCGSLFSETSAFTRVAAVTPKKKVDAVECEDEEDEQSSVSELFADLGGTVTELIGALRLLRQRKDAQQEELHNTISGLQVAQQAASSRHEAEVTQLKHQLHSLNGLVEKSHQALQQKAQDEKTVAKLMADVQDTQEALNKYKTDGNELRKEVVELRRSLQQAKVESQFLRGELGKPGIQSANPALFMEEKIQLLKEVERLKLSLQEVEQARVKLLERAKKHQSIHQANQQKSENELQILNKMINKVRETLLSLPLVVKNCEQLQQLVDYIG